MSQGRRNAGQNRMLHKVAHLQKDRIWEVSMSHLFTMYPPRKVPSPAEGTPIRAATAAARLAGKLNWASRNLGKKAACPIVNRVSRLLLRVTSENGMFFIKVTVECRKSSRESPNPGTSIAVFLRSPLSSLTFKLESCLFVLQQTNSA